MAAGEISFDGIPSLGSAVARSKTGVTCCLRSPQLTSDFRPAMRGFLACREPVACCLLPWCRSAAGRADRHMPGKPCSLRARLDMQADSGLQGLLPEACEVMDISACASGLGRRSGIDYGEQ